MKAAARCAFLKMAFAKSITVVGKAMAL